MRNIYVGGILGQVHCALNADFRLKVLGKARSYDLGKARSYEQKDECGEYYWG
jgi:hypothetical protein